MLKNEHKQKLNTHDCNLFFYFVLEYFKLVCDRSNLNLLELNFSEKNNHKKNLM